MRYFAYGSNMNLDQMARRCPQAEVIGSGVLEGYELAFRGGGVATILPKAGGRVPGVLWEISPQDERQLDRYEGFPRLYGRRTLPVRGARGEKTTCMVYVMNSPYKDAPALPSGFYLQGILEGCRQNRVNRAPVLRALAAAQREVARRRAQRTKNDAAR